LLDLRLELDRLWGSAASRLAERIAQAASLRRAANLLEQELAVRAARASAPDALVAAAIDGLQPWRAGGVGEVASDLFISPRQMRRRFAEVLGYGPKTLQRTLRFQGFLALIHEDHAQDGALAYFAAAAGYADQAHLTRECVRLSARTPNALLREMRQACGIDHDHGASLAPLRHALLGARVS
jgi:AraC-like DNA-binding protein